jgi:hypothetical protein
VWLLLAPWGRLEACHPTAGWKPAPRSADRLIHLVALAGAGLAVLSGTIVYGDTWSYTRVFSWLPLGVWLSCVQLHWRWPLVALSTPSLLPLAVLLRVWLAPI